MIFSKNWLALGSCVCGLLVASSALCEEPKTRATAAETPRRVESRSAAPLPPAPSLLAALRLPKFFSFNVWSAPATSTRAAANVPRATECRDHCTGGHGTTDDHARATAAAILAGVGAAGLVTGVVLSFAKPRKNELASIAPVFRIKLSGERAIANASWRF